MRRGDEPGRTAIRGPVKVGRSSRGRIRQLPLLLSKGGSLMSLDSQISSDPSRASPSLAAAEPPRARPDAERRPSAVAPVWLQRLSLLVLVLFCVYLGVLVMILPWWTRVWDHNLFISSHPVLAAVLHNGAMRGFISGLGLLDIWIGISEAIHYRDHRS